MILKKDIVDLLGKMRPLVVERFDGNNTKEPHISIHSEGNFDSLIIFIGEDPVNNNQMDKLEIGGVLATIEQWKEALLPILGISYKK